MQLKRFFKKINLVRKYCCEISTRKYSREHEWLIIDEEKNEAEIGISEYAKNQLGDIVYIEFPEANAQFNEGESVGQMESVKTVGEIIMPLNATILQINQQVQEDTSLLNNNTENTWLLKVKLAAGQ